MLAALLLSLAAPSLAEQGDSLGVRLFQSRDWVKAKAEFSSAVPLASSRVSRPSAFLSKESKSGNRDAIGAKVQIEACGHVQHEWERNGGSYVSRNDPRLHFGLGHCGKVDKIVIRWPRGKIQVLNNLPVNRYLTVEEPL